MNPRISATWLEEFRRCLETEWGNEAELAANIRGKPFEPRWQMVAGSCWHHILQYPERYYDPDSGRYTAEPYFWGENDVHRALEHIGDGLWEVKTVKTYPTPLGPADVVCKCDHILGLVIQDNKAKFSQKSVQDYEDSLQWRFYLDVHEAEVFRYNLWTMKEPRGKKAKAGAGHLTLKPDAPLFFNFWRYADLEAECQGWVIAFLDWACRRELYPFLLRRGTS
jgi:hypothetical protein